MEEYYKNLSLEDIEGEVWKDIKGYEGLYQVSNLGRVKSLPRFVLRNWGKSTSIKARILKPYIERPGYLCVKLSEESVSKAYKIHRLVAMAFIPNPDNLPQVNHKNEIKIDNRVENLEWCTAKYNCNYGTGKERQGRAHVGRKRPNSVIEKIREANSVPIIGVCLLTGERREFKSCVEASKLLALPCYNIRNVLRGLYHKTNNWTFIYANKK